MYPGLRATSLTSLLILGTTGLSSLALADWDGGMAIGTQLGSGESPTVRLHATNQGDPLSHFIYLDWMRESGDNSYRLGYNPTYNISKSIFSFGEFSVEQDEPDGIEREIDGLVGIGNNFFRTKNSLFTVRAGVGGSQIELVDDTEESDGYLLLGGVFTTKLIGLLKFDAVAQAKAGESQTTTNAEVGVSLRVGPNTALRYAYTAKHYNFDSGREDITNEDSFLTMTYGF